MTVKRLIILLVLLLGGFSMVFALPKYPKLVPPAISLSLPDFVGEWYGRNDDISPGERAILGPDTQFARKTYQNGRGDEIFASIVLSGPDMNTSIHRPERCLPAQGWTVIDTKAVPLPTHAGELSATRLHNIRRVRADNGQLLVINSLDYYWFVGHWNTTPSHLERTWIDMKDRVLRGQNQQWAYITVMALVTKNLKNFGRTEKQTDELITAFISEFVPELGKASASPGSNQ
jgi:EpsI family protein